VWRISTFKRALAALAVVVAAPLSAHPARGIAVAPDGRVYFSDLERIWAIGRDGALTLAREHRGLHTHALAMSPSGDLYGEDSDYRPADRSYWESIWKITPRGGFSYVYGPSRTPGRGIGLVRDARGCSYHADQTGAGGRPLVHRQCRGRAVERLVGTAADDRRFRPVLLNDVAGTALGSDGSFYFRQGPAVRRIAPDGRLSLVANRFAAENFGIAVDPAGNVYVAEFSARRIVMVDQAGSRSVVARSSQPWGPTGVAYARGALYLLEATEHRRGVEARMRVRRVSATGVARTIATVSIPLR